MAASLRATLGLATGDRAASLRATLGLATGDRAASLRATLGLAVVTSDYTASPGELVRVDAQDPVTITLPSAVGNAGAEELVKEVAGNEELVTIVAPAGQQVDGQAAVQISGPYCKARFMSDAAGWLAS